MNFLAKLASKFSAPARRVVPVSMRRRYDGATLDRLTASWTTTTSNPNSEIINSLQTLRARSRDLAQNNEYGRHFFRMLVTNVVGPRGVAFQSQARRNDGTLDKFDNDTIEAHFAEWSEMGACDVSTKLSRVMIENLFVEQVARDGEALVRKHAGFRNEGRYALEFIDPDLLDIQYNTDSKMPGENRIIMGVEVDEFYAPIAYHILTGYPSSWPAYSPPSPSRIRVPADQIIHAFIPTRPTQVRGVPWVAAGMRALRDLGGYREAAVIASRVGASKMGFWTSPDGLGAPYDGVDNAGNLVDEATPGRFDQVPDGVSLQSWDPSYPHEQFGDFNKAMLRGLAGAFGVSYFGLNNDLESVNLSSARIGQQNERDMYKAVQRFLIESLHENFFPEWLAVNLPLMGLPVSRFEKFDNPSWRPRTWPSPDPLKDAQTNALNLELKVTSPQRVIVDMGADPDEILTEIEQWNARLAELGLDAQPTTTEAPPDEGTQNNEDETTDAPA